MSIPDDNRPAPPPQPPGTGEPRTVREGPPGTIRENNAAPGTIRESNGAPGTWREGNGAPGTIRENAGAPGTIREGSGPGSRPGEAGVPYRRVNLPPRLASQFTAERDLGAGGEADLILARAGQTGALVVVRLYRHTGAHLDPALLSQLRQANREHFIGLFDWGQDDTATWEILEYAEHGSLGDLMRRRPGPWSTAGVAGVLDQLTAAVEYAHSLDLVHRDIKPQNVLIRSLSPMDLVLSDFGLARVLAQTFHQGTTSRTSAYASPEATHGRASKAGDWWSLGILMIELLTGRNPFQRPDGSWLSDATIAASLSSEEIDLSEIGDRNWQYLCQGLLTRNPRNRWGGAEVRAWRLGDRPRVHTAGPAAGHTAGRRGGAFVFANAQYTDPVALAQAFRRQWPQARRLLAGQQAGAPPFLALRDWVARQLPEDTRTLERPSPPERLLAQLILELDPASPPEFRGRDVTAAGLLQLAREAAEQNMAGEAADLLDALYADGILTVYDEAEGCAGHALLDNRWHQLVQEFESRSRGCLRRPFDEDELRVARTVLLGAAIAPDQEAVLARRAQQALADPEARRQPWFTQLEQAAFGPGLEPARYQLIAMARERAAEETAAGRLAAEQQRVQQERLRQLRNRQRVDRISPTISCLAALIGLAFAPAGLVAVFFAVRARRAGFYGAGSGTGLYLGGFESLLSIIVLILLVTHHSS